MAYEPEQPCLNGLTRNCFQQFPIFSKRLFAYRLLHVLVPPEVSKNLPSLFRQPIIWTGPVFPADWQPGDLPPEGALIPPWINFPEDWQMGDPWPEGTYLWIPVDYPDLADLGDLIVIAPGTVFPAGWKPGDPFPPGAYPAPIPPHDVSASGPLPIVYDISFIGGSGSWGAGGRGGASAYLFYEDFDTLDLTVWTIQKVVEGTVDLVSSRLRMVKTIDMGEVQIRRADSDCDLSRYSLSFLLNFISGTSILRLDFWSTDYYLKAEFTLPNQLQISDGALMQTVTLTDFTNTDTNIKFSVNNGVCIVYQDDNVKGSDLDLDPGGPFIPGTIRFVLPDTGDLRIDNVRITGV